MVKEKIFVVDDEEDILELVNFVLSKENYRVQKYETGEDLLKAIKADKPDLLLLDLMLPGIDGFDICKIIKNDEKFSDIPIIMLTAKGDEVDVVSGLELGADDYIVKPFAARVLIARVKAILRRGKNILSNNDDVIEIDNLKIHPGRHEVSVNGQHLDLTFSEFRLLQLLAQKRGWVYTRYQIVDALRGSDYPVTERAIDVQVVGLRKKLGNHGRYIETVRGVGYRFKDN
jgi:DNA-binding response OmpR family regulator